jgi:tRNA-Thr(GGU) m(6)t(6)A37 methyltransferase TsaA
MTREITLRAVGVVHNQRTTFEDEGWNAVESTIDLHPDVAEGLAGLEQFSHAVVVFYMHRDPGEPFAVRRRPRGRDDMPLLGVFAQRGRTRPNPIGVTTVAIVRVEPGRLVVRGLDALDGTPVLDLKPHFPIFDAAGTPRTPEWVDRLMRGYFDAEHDRGGR